MKIKCKLSPLVSTRTVASRCFCTEGDSFEIGLFVYRFPHGVFFSKGQVFMQSDFTLGRGKHSANRRKEETIV